MKEPTNCPECAEQAKIENESFVPELEETLSEDGKRVFIGDHFQPDEIEYKIILVCPECKIEIETQRTVIL